MANSEAPIGRLAPSELADAEALVAASGWNQVAADWRIFLHLGTVYAVRDGARVIATAATLPYGNTCAWISMVLVSEAYRRRGLATRLLRQCIDDIVATGGVPVLDATPAGRTVYRYLGFKDAWGFARLRSAQRTDVPKGADDQVDVQRISDRTWPALCAYDAAVFGLDRRALLSRMRGRLPAANLFAAREGRIAGLLLGREGRTAAHLGPLIAEDDATALALLRRALPSLEGNLYIDIADAKSTVRDALEACGFAPQRPFTRMLHGRARSFDDLRRTYAVIGPEFG
ncbi:MAG: GNAT family N-acetyltransferase [Alphaproteobacteria bacterium]|nr:GNAT family N-acetyltransferase [Alphaproteobacteria bacterium]